MAFGNPTGRGTATNKTTTYTTSRSPTAAIAVGRIAWAKLITDNSALTNGDTATHSMTDTHGHTWTKVFERTRTGGGVAQDGVTHSLWFTKITTQIETSESVSGSVSGFTTETVAQVLRIWDQTVDSGSTVQLASGGSTFDEANAADAGTLTLSGLTSKEYCFYGLVGRQDNGTTWTNDADYTQVEGAGVATSGAPAASNVASFAAYRVATLTGDTFAATITNSRQRAGALVAIEEVTGGVSGTAAVTQEAQTSSASAVETFTGTSTQTQADQTSTASGLVANPVTGTVAVTQADQTSTASAVETFSGTSATTQADQTSTASALETFTASAATTQADQISAASAVETITGTSAVTQADQTSTASGVVGGAPTGTAAVTQADQTSAGVGSVSFIGSAAITQASQTSTASGLEIIIGTVAITQADQTSTASGLLTIAGSSATTQADQMSAASGNVIVNLTGTAAVTQENQFSTASGIAGVVTFWTKAQIGFTRNQPAFTKIDAGDDPPW